jgi:hypothetical protein
MDPAMNSNVMWLGDDNSQYIAKQDKHEHVLKRLSRVVWTPDIKIIE